MSRPATLEVIVLSAWIGAAILVAAVVAPAAFRVLPTRALAGALVGQVLPVIFVSGIVAAAVAAFLEKRVAGAGTPPIEALVALGAMLAACVVAQFIVGPKIEAVRATIGGALDALDPSDPRRLRFGRLHAISVLWMGLAMLGAAWTLLRKLLTLSS